MVFLLKRVSKVVFGLFLYALGMVLCVQANVGLAPWDAFHMGVSQQTGISVGLVVILAGIVILVLVLLLKEKIGLATILNTILIGTFIDLIRATGWIPLCESFLLGLIMLVGGLFVVCLGSYYYISPALGCGPRDSLMIALSKRLKKVPVGVVRIAIESMALLVGFVLGAKVGLGTVLSAFGVGVILELVLRLYRFDIGAVVHESVFKTVKEVRTLMRRKPGENLQKTVEEGTGEIPEEVR